MKRLFLIVLAVTGFALAPSPAAAPALAPELAPIAAKHKADLAAIDQQRAAALARSATFYLNELETEDKAALQRSDLDAVAAIHKERDAVKGGLLGDLIAAPFPEKLPASLKSSRAALFDSFKRLEAEVGKLRQQINAEYLRALDGLQARAAGNPELAREIKAESDAVLGNPVTTAEGEVAVVAKKGKLINGDFTEADGNGFPVGWKLLFNGMENSPPPGETYKVVHENGRSFVHTAFEQPARAFTLTQVVDAPPFAKEAELKIQYRGSLSKVGGGWSRMGLHLVNDKNPAQDIGGATPQIEPAATWKTLTFKEKLDGQKNAKQLRIFLQSSKITGFVDYSHAELEFR